MEAIGQLAGGISHDFNNLLTVIKGYSDLLLSQTERDNPNYGDLEAIRNAADRAALLTRQLLAFSRRQVLQPTVLDLNVVVSNLSKMLRRLIGEHIEFSTILAQDLWLVKADAGQIEQVLMNLTVNARDAMPGGGQLIIETSNCQIDAEHLRERIHMKPGRYIELMVSDTGSGMTPETQSRIFEPFFTTKSTGKGTGLGLSTVYGIVKQSGGFIYVYSKPEKGTAFKIYLPETVDEATSSSSDMRPGRDSGTGLEFGKSVIDKPEVQGVACAMSKASARGRNRSAGPQPTLLQ